MTYRIAGWPARVGWSSMNLSGRRATQHFRLRFVEMLGVELLAPHLERENRPECLDPILFPGQMLAHQMRDSLELEQTMLVEHGRGPGNLLSTRAARCGASGGSECPSRAWTDRLYVQVRAVSENSSEESSGSGLDGPMSVRRALAPRLGNPRAEHVRPANEPYWHDRPSSGYRRLGRSRGQ
jgi:hypothetical protein